MATDSPGAGRMLPVNSLQTAVDAIEIILDQGEGLRPIEGDKSKAYEEDMDHEVAHYYQFQTIRDYLWGGHIKGSRDIYPVIKNPDPEMYSPEQRAANLRFNKVYTTMLNSLLKMFRSPSPTPFGQRRPAGLWS